MQTKQSLHPQLADIKDQLDAASNKAVSIVGGIGFEQLKQRPPSGAWSIAECLVHLNHSSQAEIEEIDRAFAECRKVERNDSKKPFKMDLLGRFLKWTLEPPPMFLSKMKTKKPFEPLETEPVGEVLPAFLDFQKQIKTRVDRLAAVPLDQIKVVSPFDRRVKYNLFSFFHILLAHERRHLWQAEKVKETIFQAR